jgi:hypothetical protein
MQRDPSYPVASGEVSCWKWGETEEWGEQELRQGFQIKLR